MGDKPTRRKRNERRAHAKQAPSEIAPGVFVGNWNDAVAFEGARFCVLDEQPSDMPEGTHVRIYDEKTDRADRKALDTLAGKMRSARSSGQTVLVFCGHGIYRSPLAAAWYLHRTEGLSFAAAIERVCEMRPQAKPASQWLGNYRELAAP